MLTALYLFDRGENVKNRMLVAFSLFDIGERQREIRTECWRLSVCLTDVRGRDKDRMLTAFCLFDRGEREREITECLT